MNMKTSLNGRIALAVSEGIVDTAYKDSVGVWTIGIGHTASAGAPNPTSYIGKKMSIKEIMDLFEKDIKKFEDAVNRNVRVKLAQHEFDALVHFVYNIGESGFKQSKLLANLNSGRKAQAWQTGFHGWLKPPELRGRRDKERRIAQVANYGGTVAPLYTADRNGRLKRTGQVDLKTVMSGSGGSAKTSTPAPAVPLSSNPRPTPQPTEGSFWAFLASLFDKIFNRS